MALGAGLVCPEPGGSAFRDVFSGMLRLRTQALSGAHWGSLPDGLALRSVLASALRASPGAVFSAMRRTSVHVHFEAARLVAPEQNLRVGVATLFCELAAHGALPSPVRLAAPPPTVLLRSRLSRLTLDGPAELTSGRITVGGRDAVATNERVMHPLDAEVVLSLADDNPLSMNEAHPEKQGNAVDLGGHPVEEWLASLRDAFARIRAHLPALSDEMALGLGQVVPVGYDEQRHLSASYREAIGTIYLTLHPDAMTMTEAVIHEFQHNKLNAALDLDPFLENAFEARVPSPVRPDLRPLHGVLLAVHAFQPIAELYARMERAGDPLALTPRFRERFSDVVRLNHEGLTTVEAHGQFTAAGARMLDEMRMLDARHRALVA